MLEVWVGERAAATLEWLSEGPKPRVRRERELTEAAGSPDHQGVMAWCEPYPYADAWELASVDRPPTLPPVSAHDMRWWWDKSPWRSRC